jgi:glucuronokinase
LSSTGAFTLAYDTNIPRQVGLAGSSCILTCVFKALMHHHGLSWDDIGKPVLPTVILSVEANELGIHAGLMDRVVQVYGGCVTMDFTDAAATERNGHAVYEALPVEAVPQLFLVYAVDPSDSGRIHNNVKERWKRGDPAVNDAVTKWVALVDAANALLRAEGAALEDPIGDVKEQRRRRDSLQDAFGALMDRNFDLRRAVYGDECLGWKNIRMVELARRFGASAKFPGSGGAVVICPRASTDIWAMRTAMMNEGFVLVPIVPPPP